MLIPTGKLVLALMGFLHLRRAYGMVPATPLVQMELRDFPERHIVVRMEDDCFATGNLEDAFAGPSWLQPREAHPAPFQFYVRTQNQQFHGAFGDLHGNPFESSAHDLDHHPIPSRIAMHVPGREHYTDDSEFYMASDFQVLTKNLLESLRARTPFPQVDYIYVTVPRGKQYRAPLQRRYFPKEIVPPPASPPPPAPPGVVSRFSNFFLGRNRAH